MVRYLSFLLVILFLLTALFFMRMVAHSSQDPPSPNSSFTRITQNGSITIFREINTNVLYAVYGQGYRGGMTVMFNSDGKPLLYQDWLDLSLDNDALAESQ